MIISSVQARIVNYMKYFYLKLYFLKLINPFSTNAPLLYPLKTSENQGSSDVFRGYRSRILIENGLSNLLVAQSKINRDDSYFIIISSLVMLINAF